MYMHIYTHVHMDVPVLARRKNRHKIAAEMWSEYHCAYAFLHPLGKSNPAWKHMYMCAVTFLNNPSYLIEMEYATMYI